MQRMARIRNNEDLIRQLSQDDPKVPANLFNSIHRVDLDSLVGWKYKGERHSFLDGE